MTALHFPGGPLELPSHWPARHPGPHPTSRSTPGVVPAEALTIHMALAHASRVVLLEERILELEQDAIPEAVWGYGTEEAIEELWSERRRLIAELNGLTGGGL